MPAEHVIASLGQKVLWENEQAKGDFPVGLQGDDREVLVFHDASSKYAAPKVGDKLYGDVSKDGRGNWRFKRAARADSPSSGGGGMRQRASSEGPGLRWHNAPYNSSASHPRDEVRMIRTSALSSAPAFVEQMLTLSLEDVPPPKTPEQYWHLVDRVVARIEKSYGQALGAYDERVSPQQQLAAEVPADQDGLTAEQEAHDKSLPF